MKKFIVVLTVLLASTIVFSATINIPTDQTTIQDGINAATNGDTVLVSDGTYYENINFKGKAVTVASQFFVDGDTSHISNTIIDGSQPSHPDSASVVYFDSGEDTTSVLCGFTITKGSGTRFVYNSEQHRNGGGLWAIESGGKIVYNKIVDNQINSNETWGSGAGIMAWPGENDVLLLRNNVFSNNKLALISSGSNSYGAGAYINSEGTIICEHNIFTKNVIDANTAVGGGLFVGGNPSLNSHIILNANVFSHNETQGSSFAGGGGVFIGGCSPLLTNNLIYNNYSPTGGGLRINYAGDATINPVLLNNTIVENSAIEGGGIYTVTHSKGVLINNIVWNNSATDAYPGIKDLSTGKLQISHSNIQDKVWAGEGNISVDPIFADTLFHLSEESRCIGSGIAAIDIDGQMYSAPEMDIEGNPRPNPAGSDPDMGALENPLDLPSFYKLVPEDYATIQGAINSADDGDVVLVSDGTYYENINFKGKAITVASQFFVDADTSHIENTIIDGSRPTHPDSGSVVTFNSGEDTTSVLLGFTLTNGTGTKASTWWGDHIAYGRGGGGIYCVNSGASILFNKIINNTIVANSVPAAVGGGIAAFPYDGKDTTNVFDVIIKGNQIMNNKITSNEANGGGIYFRCNGKIDRNLISYNSCVSNNSLTVGGGVYCTVDPSAADPRNVTFSNNTITHNSATSKVDWAGGGGLFILRTSAFILNNNIRFNELSAAITKQAHGAGLGLSNVEDKSSVNGNTITHNSVTKGFGQGGGIDLINSSPDIINNTITDNKAASGGGIFVNDGSTPVIINTIVWDNKADIDGGIHGSPVVAYSNIQDDDNTDVWPGDGNILDSPNFVDAEGGNYRLADWSRCIGAGIAELTIDGVLYKCPSVGLGGEARPSPLGSNPDLGAYEHSSDTYTEYPTTVKDGNEKVLSFALYSNYPNPFNPTTTIQYEVPKQSHIRLAIYDVLGQEVKTLLNRTSQPGAFETTWDGRDEYQNQVAGGVYFCRMEAGNFVKTIKLALVR